MDHDPDIRLNDLPSRHFAVLAAQARALKDIDDLSILLNVPGSTLAAVFAKYGTPRSIVIGRRKLYRQVDIDAWLAGLGDKLPLLSKVKSEGFIPTA